MLEIISKLDHTRSGWEVMHTKAHTLAAEAGVPLSRIQKLMEAEGYDSSPLRLVVASNNVMGLDASSQRQFKFPPAVNGSELAQQVWGVLIQFINRSEEERLRARAQQELAEADRRRAANRQRIEAEQDALDQQLRAKRQSGRPGIKGKVQDKAALEARTKATAATITYGPAEGGEEE